jgi:hypothetical protein
MEQEEVHGGATGTCRALAEREPFAMTPKAKPLQGRLLLPQAKDGVDGDHHHTLLSSIRP